MVMGFIALVLLFVFILYIRLCNEMVMVFTLCASFSDKSEQKSNFFPQRSQSEVSEPAKIM